MVDYIASLSYNLLALKLNFKDAMIARISSWMEVNNYSVIIQECNYSEILVFHKWSAVIKMANVINYCWLGSTRDLFLKQLEVSSYMSWDGTSCWGSAGLENMLRVED